MCLQGIEEIKDRLAKAGHPEPNPANYDNHNEFFKDYRKWLDKLKIVEGDAMNGRLKNRKIKFNAKKPD